MNIMVQMIDLLGDEKEIYKHFSRLLDDEKKAIIANDFNEVNGILWQKKDAVAHLRQVENKRRQLCKMLSRASGINPGDLKMSAVIELAEEPHAGRMREVWKGLKDIINQVREAGKVNKILIEGILGLVKNSVGLLENLSGAGPVYRRTGKLYHHGNTGKFFCESI